MCYIFRPGPFGKFVQLLLHVTVSTISPICYLGYKLPVQVRRRHWRRGKGNRPPATTGRYDATDRSVTTTFSSDDDVAMSLFS